MMRKTILPLILTAILGVTATRAQSVFEPASYSAVWHMKYHAMLHEYLLVANTNEYYLCTPSFSNEYALSFHGDSLVFIRPGGKIYSIWYSVYNNQKLFKPKVHTERWSMPMSKEEHRVISRLLEAATMTANFYEPRLGIDGTTYELCRGSRAVNVWSPGNGSRTYRTVTAMDSLCIAVHQGDSVLLKRQIEVCRGLTSEFRQLYPLSFFVPKEWTIKSNGQVRSISLKSNKGLNVGLKIDSVNEKQDVAYMESIKDSLALWSRELFLNQEDCIISVFLNDTTAARCQVNGNTSMILTIPRKFLTRDLIFSTVALGEGYYILASDGTWKPILREDYSWWPNQLYIFR